MRAQKPVGLRVGDDLDDPFRLIETASPAIGQEGELAHAILAARFLDLLLGLADAGHLGPGINDARNRPIIHMRFLTGQ